MTDSVAAALDGRTRLLVFDNCEHVLDAAADLIEAILASSATVKVLATSREGLRVDDEQLWPVPSLDMRTGSDSAAATLVHRQRPGGIARCVFRRCPKRQAQSWRSAGASTAFPLAIELAASRMVSMTGTELRDRLDDRFRLLVGSRRGLERHQTLRHAVQWSYDLLDDAEKVLLAGCSVFAGGFDLDGACAVTGYDDDFTTLGSARRARAQVASRRRPVVGSHSVLDAGDDPPVRRRTTGGLRRGRRCPQTRTPATSPGGRPTYLLCGTVRDSAKRTVGSALELANLRAAFRWAADHDDIDTAATIATYVAFVGTLVEQYEPLSWAEEIIGPALTLQHRRLLALCVTVTQIYLIGRIEDAIHYGQRAQSLTGNGSFDRFPFGYGAYHGSPNIAIGRPDRWVDACRTQLEHDDDSHGYSRACLAMALALGGDVVEARSALRGVVALAETTSNPHSLSMALLAEGLVYRYTEPAAALAALQRSLNIAQESGNRFGESHTAVTLAELEAHHGAPQSAFDHLTLAMRNYHDTGNIATQRSPLAILAGLLHRLGHLGPAATIAEFADSPLTRMAFPEITTTITQLREALGDEAYESFGRRGRSMTNAAMAAYAFEQIDLARANLPATDASP